MALAALHRLYLYAQRGDSVRSIDYSLGCRRAGHLAANPAALQRVRREGAQTIHPSVGSIGDLGGSVWQSFPPDRMAWFCYSEKLELPMCNSYAETKGQAAIVALTGALRDTTGNLPPMPGIFPDYMAPVVRNAPDGVRELTMLRWGMPGPPQFGGAPITNIRNAKSPHWKARLKPANRCVVPRYSPVTPLSKSPPGAFVRFL